jgi:hypothetical protein
MGGRAPTPAALAERGSRARRPDPSPMHHVSASSTARSARIRVVSKSGTRASPSWTTSPDLGAAEDDALGAPVHQVGHDLAIVDRSAGADRPAEDVAEDKQEQRGQHDSHHEQLSRPEVLHDGARSRLAHGSQETGAGLAREPRDGEAALGRGVRRDARQSAL